MKIAFTHNLQLSSSEEEAEYDRPETVAAITEALRNLGHVVEPVEVSGPASRTVARLEALSPDLVFNTAEGTQGRFREAFYPALFERLSLPFTGSDAYVCALTLDKQLTKMVVEPAGVPVPKGKLITDLRQLRSLSLRFPVIAKPNYEGSSMGITVDSVVDTPQDLESRVVGLLSRYAAGVLVEEFIIGRDVVVPFVEKAAVKGGVLEPASYDFDPRYTGNRKYQLYDYELKTEGSDGVSVRVPADIGPDVRARVMEYSHIAFRTLGVVDAGRIDFRITDKGEVFFLEVNALPSLEKGASIYESAKLAGLSNQEDVLDLIVKSAADRYGINTRTSRRSRRRPLQIGLTFNLKAVPGSPLSEEDSDAEFDNPTTIASIRQALESFGHKVVELEATPELPSALPAAGVDLVFNIAEGLQGRSRESQVPAILELLGIPYTGSDPTALALSLDKGLAKRVVRQAAIRTPEFVLMVTGKERVPKELGFPAILKPLYEGSSKGILMSSVVENESELRDVARELITKYKQPILLEAFLPGREFTVALLGERKPRVLPIMEVIFTDKEEKFPIYSYEKKKADASTVKFQVPARFDDERHRREIERVARNAFVALGCRDLARVDVRLDERGRVHFMECNPLPGLAPGFSDFCVIGEAAGMTYRSLIGEVVAPAIRRFRERQKENII